MMRRLAVAPVLDVLRGEKTVSHLRIVESRLLSFLASKGEEPTRDWLPSYASLRTAAGAEGDGAVTGDGRCLAVCVAYKKNMVRSRRDRNEHALSRRQADASASARALALLSDPHGDGLVVDRPRPRRLPGRRGQSRRQRLRLSRAASRQAGGAEVAAALPSVAGMCRLCRSSQSNSRAIPPRATCRSCSMPLECP